MSKKITGRKRDVNPRLKDRIENRKTKINDLKKVKKVKKVIDNLSQLMYT